MTSVAQKGKKKASGPETEKVKATWDPKAHELWIDTVLGEIRAGNRVNGTITRLEWKNFVSKFNEATGRVYERIQLKNHYDSVRKEWLAWDNLLAKETGLGWDANRQTVVAPDEWWEAKIKKYPEVAKFRFKGLEHSYKLEQIYRDVTATGDKAWAPTDGLVPPILEHSSVGGDDPRENSDSQEDNLESEPTVQKINVNSSSGIGSSGHGLKSGSKQDNNRGNKKKSGAAKLSKQIDRLCEAAENRNNLHLPGCSIKEVLDHLATIPECPHMSELFLFATDLFMKREYRETYVALGDDAARLIWLKRKVDMQSGGRTHFNV